MCTVTFIKKGLSDFIITSNRDEAKTRKTLSPKEYIDGDVKLVYPKDEVAGGTWIGTSSHKRIICLMNGGFVAHERKDSYKMSRGIVVKELLASENAIQYIEEFDFNDMEPFTIIMIEWKEGILLWQLVWDGKEKHFHRLPDENQIWSSSSLYTQSMKAQREKWFSEFLEQNEINKNTILDFHHNAGIGNKDIDLQIDRGFLKTVSITQIEKENDNLKIFYKNLQTEEIEEIDFSC